MSLSKREFKPEGAAVIFDPAALGEALRAECPEVDLPVFDSGTRLAASYDLMAAIRAVDEVADGKSPLLSCGLVLKRLSFKTY